MEHQDAHLRQAASETSNTTPQTNRIIGKCQNFLIKHSRYKPATRTACTQHNSYHQKCMYFPCSRSFCCSLPEFYETSVNYKLHFGKHKGKKITKTNREKGKSKIRSVTNVVANYNTREISKLTGFCFLSVRYCPRSILILVHQGEGCMGKRSKTLQQIWPGN